MLKNGCPTFSRVTVHPDVMAKFRPGEHHILNYRLQPFSNTTPVLCNKIAAIQFFRPELIQH